MLGVQNQGWGCSCIRITWHEGSRASSSLFSFFLSFFFFYFWLHWVFDAARGLSLVAASGGYSSLRCTGFSLRWLLLLWSMGSIGTQAQQLWLAGSRAQAQQLWRLGSVVVARGLQSAGSVVVAHELSCSVACGIFPDQGSDPCPLHWQADS